MKDEKTALDKDLEKSANDFIRIVNAAASIDEKDVMVHVGGRKEAVLSPFVMVFHDKLSELLLADRLAMIDIKVLMGICKILQFGNLVSLSQQGLADSLGVHRVSVSKSLKKMTDLGIVVDTKLGRFINPAIIVKGKLSAIEDDVWDAAKAAGYPSPVRSVAKKQGIKSADEAGADEAA